MRRPLLEKVKPRLLRTVEKACADGARCAKILFRQSESSGCEFENSRLKNSSLKQGVSYRTQVVRDGKIGVAGGNDLDKVDEMMDRAMTLARAGSTAHFDVYPGPGDTPEVALFSEKTLGLTREDMVDACQKIVDRVRSYGDDMFICASADRHESERLLVTSGGVCRSEKSTSWSLGGMVQKTEGSDMLFSGYSRSWRDLNSFFDPDYVSENILEDLKHGENIASVPAGNMKALLTPEIFRMILYGFISGINGRNVAKGDSPLKDKLGEKIFDSTLRIEDDPHMDYCPGAAVTDGDGIPTRRQTLIESGVLKTFLYDLDSAGLADAEPTGNAGCSPYAVTVAPGEKDTETLISEMDSGLWVKELIGFGQSNLINGDFSCNVGLGYFVRNGSIVGRVKNTMIAGNIYNLLASGVQPGADLDPVRRVPPVLIENASVHSAEK